MNVRHNEAIEETTMSSSSSVRGKDEDGDEEKVVILSSLGFSPSLAARGLRSGDGTVTSALEWMLDEGGGEEERHRGDERIRIGEVEEEEPEEEWSLLAASGPSSAASSDDPPEPEGGGRREGEDEVHDGRVFSAASDGDEAEEEEDGKPFARNPRAFAARGSGRDGGDRAAVGGGERVVTDEEDARRRRKERGGDVGAVGVPGPRGSFSANRRPDDAASADFGEFAAEPGTEEEEEGREEDALSAYVVPQRRVHHDRCGQPSEELERVVPTCDPREQTYEGVPVPVPVPVRDGTAAKDSAEETSSEERRTRRRLPLIILGTIAVFAVIAAAVLGAIVAKTRERPAEPFDSAANAMPTFTSADLERFGRARAALLSRMDGLGLPESSLAALGDPASPQGRALAWLLTEDGRRVDPDEDPLSLAQRYVLATLHFSTGGPESWADACDFLSAEHECAWNVPSDYTLYGENYTYIGAACIKMDNVTVDHIFIVNNNMTGTLPVELAMLPGLTYLDFYRNSLSGEIPAQLLFGTPSLEAFWLGENKLSGALPEVPADSPATTRLTDIELCDNRLTSTIPASFARLSNLAVLELCYNELTGSVPVAELGALHKLKLMDIGTNNLTGTLRFPPGSFRGLNYLLVHENSLSGTFPRSVLELENLTEMWFEVNSFTGGLPPDIGRLGRLEYLDARNNLLTGTLPPELTALGRLHHFDLLGNSFDGTVPPSIGRLSSLRHLSLGENDFRGTLPDSLGDLGNLTWLRLAANNFSGSVPLSLANLSGSLEVLELHANGFTGDLSFVCDMPGLFAVADCHGEEPEVTCECCSECCLDGVVDGPTSFGCFPAE